MKLIWRNHSEDFMFFLKLYEWSFKILGWLTALGALKFAYEKTGQNLFYSIYVVFLCVYLFPVVTVIYFEFDFPTVKPPLLKRALERLPSYFGLLAAVYFLNWA